MSIVNHYVTYMDPKCLLPVFAQERHNIIMSSPEESGLKEERDI